MNIQDDGYGIPEDAINPTLADYRQHGFLGQLAKPFQLSELANEIERVIATTSSGQQ